MAISVSVPKDLRPTLNAAVSDGLLSIQVHDTDSGAKAVYVNGYEFTNLTNGTLNIRLQQFDAGYQYFTISALDNAGNMSEVYKTANPYYKDPADASMYMDRFDTLYEQGKMEHLMPTANQRHIIEHIPLVEWENEYVSINNRFVDIADKELSVVEYEMLLGMEPVQVSVDGLMEIMNHNAELWNYPMDEKDHCLQENIPVVTVRDGEEARYFEIPEELVAKVREAVCI